MVDHCFMILAHSNAPMFRRLAGLLATRFHVIAHIDAKADQSLFDSGMSAVSFLQRRRDIGWGSFAMVEVTLELLRQGMDTTDATTFTLISGDCYPIRSLDNLEYELGMQANRIDLTVVAPNSQFLARITNVFAPDTKLGALRPGVQFQERYLDDSMIEQMSALVAARANRPDFLSSYTYAKGSQWWSLQRDTVERVLELYDTNQRFVEALRYSAIPDEAFFQTATSSLKVPKEKIKPSIMFAKWDTSPAPHLFRHANEIEFLRSTKPPDRLFARKFADDSTELLDRIESDLW